MCGISLVINLYLYPNRFGETGDGNSSAGGFRTDNAGNETESQNVWSTRILNALDYMFQTHVLQIDLVNPADRRRQFFQRKKDSSWWQKYYWKVDNHAVVEG